MGLWQELSLLCDCAAVAAARELGKSGSNVAAGAKVDANAEVYHDQVYHDINSDDT